MSNLSIKPDIMQILNLPFIIKYSKLGKLTIDIPSLFSKPIKAEIDEIFILIVPLNEKDKLVDDLKKIDSRFQFVKTSATQQDSDFKEATSDITH
jgi:hypothetical protein